MGGSFFVQYKASGRNNKVTIVVKIDSMSDQAILNVACVLCMSRNQNLLREKNWCRRVRPVFRIERVRVEVIFIDDTNQFFD